ncbi:MAG: hypothetical protein IT372_19070 [Polyangiaceae bacterium]|nr:hypothetical protein [Polyangiaceae bacterium]
MNAHMISRAVRIASQLVGLSLIAASAACVADTSEPGIESIDVDADEVYTRTIVHLAEDGTERVVQVQITRAEQLREPAELAAIASGEREGLGTAAQAISQDFSCLDTSIQMYDQTNFTGNEICFSGSGATYLYNYCRTGDCMLRWNQAVRSYKSGTASGLFSYRPYFTCGSSQGTCNQFASNTDYNSATSCEQNANYLGLVMQCNPA